MNCPHCSKPMKLLLTSFYCPNECDKKVACEAKPRPKAAPKKSPSEKWVYQALIDVDEDDWKKFQEEFDEMIRRIDNGDWEYKE